MLLFSGLQVTVAEGCKGYRKSPSDTAKKYQVAGVLTQTSSYCGGAAPPEQVLKKLATPSPFPAKKFYVRSGKVNSTKAKTVAHFVTDENGMFSLQLPPGTYSIIVEEQLEPLDIKKLETPQFKADEKCLQQWWIKPFYLLVVKDHDITTLSFNIHHTCFTEHDMPCLQYIGPAIP